jgi:1-acyl-sn-glycerol-3-phosphate acyltransferase
LQSDSGLRVTLSHKKVADMSDSQFRLLTERRYAPFFATQALGALNDNLLKNALVILATYHAAEFTRLNPNVLTQIAGGLYILPFLLFSATAGQLADKYDKAGIMRIIKLVEVGIMIVAGVGFAIHNLMLLLAALVGMGLHSTFFGPAKYGYLPQTLSERELVGGNALLESGTFLAILFGTLLAGVMAGFATSTGVIMGLFSIAFLGVLASRRIPSVSRPDPGLTVRWNPFTTTWAILRETQGNRTVFLSLLGISWFWALGAVILGALPGMSRFVLGGNESVVTVLLAIFSIGIGAGSLACEKLSRRSVEIGLVPFGSIGLSLALWCLYAALPSSPAAHLNAWEFLRYDWWIALTLTAIGLFGGLFIVPLYALVQSRSEPSHVSRVQAANNTLNALALVLGASASGLLLADGVSLARLILIFAIVNAGVAIYIYTLVPEFLYRFLCWCLVTLVYRLRISGSENIPDKGPALVVCNHVSYADALVVAAGVWRPMRFVMDYRIYNLPFLHWIFSTSRAIPIASRKENPQLLEQAYTEIVKTLGDGEVVCIFPEGGLTYDGEMAEFRPGLLRVLKEMPVPVIPLAISGLWGSLFSRAALSDRLFRYFRLFRRVRLSAGPEQAPGKLDLPVLRATVLALRGARR